MATPEQVAQDFSGPAPSFVSSPDDFIARTLRTAGSTFTPALQAVAAGTGDTAGAQRMAAIRQSLATNEPTDLLPTNPDLDNSVGATVAETLGSSAPRAALLALTGGAGLPLLAGETLASNSVLVPEAQQAFDTAKAEAEARGETFEGDRPTLAGANIGGLGTLGAFALIGPAASRLATPALAAVSPSLRPLAGIGLNTLSNVGADIGIQAATAAATGKPLNLTPNALAASITGGGVFGIHPGIEQAGGVPDFLRARQLRDAARTEKVAPGTPPPENTVIKPATEDETGLAVAPAKEAGPVTPTTASPPEAQLLPNAAAQVAQASTSEPKVVVTPKAEPEETKKEQTPPTQLEPADRLKVIDEEMGKIEEQAGVGDDGELSIADPDMRAAYEKLAAERIRLALGHEPAPPGAPEPVTGLERPDVANAPPPFKTGEEAPAAPEFPEAQKAPAVKPEDVTEKVTDNRAAPELSDDLTKLSDDELAQAESIARQTKNDDALKLIDQENERRANAAGNVGEVPAGEERPAGATGEVAETPQRGAGVPGDEGVAGERGERAVPPGLTPEESTELEANRAEQLALFKKPKLSAADDNRIEQLQNRADELEAKLPKGPAPGGAKIYGPEQMARPGLPKETLQRADDHVNNNLIPRAVKVLESLFGGRVNVITEPRANHNFGVSMNGDGSLNLHVDPHAGTWFRHYIRSNDFKASAFARKILGEEIIHAAQLKGIKNIWDKMDPATRGDANDFAHKYLTNIITGVKNEVARLRSIGQDAQADKLAKTISSSDSLYNLSKGQAGGEALLEAWEQNPVHGQNRLLEFGRQLHQYASTGSTTETFLNRVLIPIGDWIKGTFNALRDGLGLANQGAYGPEFDELYRNTKRSLLGQDISLKEALPKTTENALADLNVKYNGVQGGIGKIRPFNLFTSLEPGRETTFAARLGASPEQVAAARDRALLPYNERKTSQNDTTGRGQNPPAGPGSGPVSPEVPKGPEAGGAELPHPENPAVAFRARQERNEAIRDLFQSSDNWNDLHSLFNKYKIPNKRFLKETEKYQKAYERAEDRGTEPPDEHEWAERIQYAAGDDVDEWAKKQGSVPQSSIDEDTSQNQIRRQYEAGGPELPPDNQAEELPDGAAGGHGEGDEGPTGASVGRGNGATGQVGQNAGSAPKSFVDRAFDRIKNLPIIGRIAHRLTPESQEIRDIIQKKLQGKEAEANNSAIANRTAVRLAFGKEDRDAGYVALASGAGRIGDEPQKFDIVPGKDKDGNATFDIKDEKGNILEIFPTQAKADEWIKENPPLPPATTESVKADIASEIAKGKAALASESIPQTAKDTINKWLPVYEKALNKVEDLTPGAKRAKEIYDQLHTIAAASGANIGYRTDYAQRAYEQNKTRGGAPIPPESLINGGRSGVQRFSNERTYQTLMDAMIGKRNEMGDWSSEKPKSLDLADLIANRTYATYDMAGQKALENEFQTVQYPGTKEPVFVPAPKGDDSLPPNYTKVDGPLGTPLYVYQPVADLFKTLYSPSAVKASDVGNIALNTAAVLKHGTLALDTFHLARTEFKAAFDALANGGFKAAGDWFKNHPSYTEQGGMGKYLALTDLRPQDIPAALKAGIIRPEDAAYVKGEGKDTLRRMGDSGLLPGRFSDNLWKQASPFLRAAADFVGKANEGAGKVAHAATDQLETFNKFTFDRLTRAAMVASFENRLAKIDAQYPELTEYQRSRKAGQEVNEQFGNIGNSGIFKSRTMKDLSQIFMLAPNWVQSQVMNEARGYGQLAQSGLDATYGKKLPNGERERVARLGNSGRFLAQTALTALAANQAINLATRGQLTFQNPEKDHKWDAWIPGGKDGFFYSPLAFPAEYTHQIKNYSQYEGVGGAISHIATNKLSPLANAAKVVATQKNYLGQKLTPGQTAVEAAKTLAPVPILASSTIKGLTPSAKAGTFEQNLAKSFGIPLDRAPDAVSQAYSAFQPYRKADNGEHAPSAYKDLRTLVQNGADPDAIKAEVANLNSQGHTTPNITKSFTTTFHPSGTVKGDLQGLKEHPEYKEIFDAAKKQKDAERQVFMKALQTK